jgi:hypothetical protein
MASLGDLVLQGGTGAPIQGGALSVQGGTYNPQTPANVPVSSATAKAATPVTTPAGVSNPTYNATGVGGTTLNAPAYIQGINQEYGAQINAGPTNLALLSGANDAAQTGANTNTAAQEAAFATQGNAQKATLQNTIGSQQNQQQLSLAELADQIRGQHQGLQAQLGAAGAGSSSAVGQGEAALANEQNTQRANINQQGNANITNAQTQIAGIDAVTQANFNQLEVAKKNQLQQIANNYASLLTQLSTALQTAQGEQKARLASYGQQLSASALDNLSSLDSQIKGHAQTLINQGVQGAQGLQNVPQAQDVKPISFQPLSPFAPTTANQGNATATPTGGSLSRLLQGS